MTRNADQSRTLFLAVLTAGLLVLLAALVAPIATLDQLFLDPDTYSIIGSIVNLLSRGDFLLAVLIAAFSIVFPILKYLILILLVWKRSEQEEADKSLRLIRFLGKWSMLDVFVTVITFGAANLGVLSQIEIHWGIYLYAAGVILSMCAAMVLSWETNSKREAEPSQSGIGGLVNTGLSISAFVCFVVGITLPLIEIQKWIFWESHYSLLSALQHLLANGEYLLPIVLLVFVILLPLVRFALSIALRLQVVGSQRLARMDEFLEEWAMFDVYMLAMLLVATKLSDSAAVNLQPGFWLLGLAAVLSAVESLRRRLAAGEGSSEASGATGGNAG